MDKILIVDGSNLVKRCFFAIPSRNSEDNIPVHAIYGFIRTLINEASIFKFKTIYVAFDTKTSSNIRREIYPEYKLNRKPKSDEDIQQRKQLNEQCELLIGILKSANIHVLRNEKYEADDIIASLAKVLKTDNQIYILSADKDLLQLIDKQVMVISPGLANRQKIVVGNHNFTQFSKGLKFPKQIIDLKVLSGDSSDNIKGLTRIGDKTALKLIGEFETVDQMRSNLDKLPEKIQKLFKDESFILERNKKIITLIDNIKIPEKFFELKSFDFKSEKMKSLYKQYNIDPWQD